MKYYGNISIISMPLLGFLFFGLPAKTFHYFLIQLLSDKKFDLKGNEEKNFEARKLFLVAINIIEQSCNSLSSHARVCYAFCQFSQYSFFSSFLYISFQLFADGIITLFAFALALNFNHSFIVCLTLIFNVKVKL